MDKRKFVAGLVFLCIFLCLLSFSYAQTESPGTNDLMAEVGLRSMSAAILTYAQVNHGNFPKDVVSDLINADPPYLSRDYAGLKKDGFAYSVDFFPDGYKLSATPVICGMTGTKMLVLEARGAEVEKIIKGDGAPADIEIKEYVCK